MFNDNVMFNVIKDLLFDIIQQQKKNRTTEVMKRGPMFLSTSWDAIQQPISEKMNASREVFLFHVLSTASSQSLR